MVTEDQKVNIAEGLEADIDFKEVALRYVSYWKWILLSIAVAVSIAYIKVKKIKPLYEASATMMIKSDDNSGLGELAALKSLSLSSESRNSQDEIMQLSSRALLESVVKNLKLNVSYINKRRSYNIDMYKDSPISIMFSIPDSAVYNKNEWINIYVESPSHYYILDSEGEKLSKHHFGEEIKTKNCGLAKIVNNGRIKQYIGKELAIKINGIENVVNEYIGLVKINQVDKTNALNLSMKNESKEKAIDIINQIISQYNDDAIADINKVSKNTANFIEGRIQYISKELFDVEIDVEQFKKSNKLIDLQSNAQMFMSTASETQALIFETMLQYNLTDYLYDYMKENKTMDNFIPENLADMGSSTSVIISNYNTLLIERNRMLKYSSNKNPVVIEMNDRLKVLRVEIEAGILNYRKSLKYKIDKLKEKEGSNEQNIAIVPGQERVFRDVQRQQQIKETLYLYLLQKREETNIALAVTVGNVKIIDSAYSNGANIATKPQKVYSQYLLGGLIIPLIIIYLLGLLDNKVHGKKDIDKLNIPFLGDVPFTDDKDKVVVLKANRSSVAEAFRLLRTNLAFLMRDYDKMGKSIFVTSSIAGEGKSFVSLNVASVLASTGKKVILVGMDLRAPKLLTYFGMNEREGVTNYISNANLELERLIVPAPNVPNLDLLPSGIIPPNPAELLMDNKVKEMFDMLKAKYDYVVVDTAPVGLVTDTLIISKYADVFLYVVRAGILEKKMLSLPKMLYDDKRLPNMSVVLNCTGQKKGYGYGGYGGYGYGYGEERKKKTTFQKIFKS